jgi:propanol-preferring alcohol dehydrogenase
VAEVGGEVSDLVPGDRVVPHLFVASAECRYTRAGQHAQASDLAGVLGVTMPGAFAEYFRVPARNLLKLPNEVPFDLGGLTSCALITAVHALRRARLQPGDTAIVLGVGGIGLLIVQLLRNAGVRVIALSRSAESRRRAIDDGAEAAFSSDPTSQSAIQRHLGGTDNVDCVFEMVGFASTMRLASRVVRRGGKIVVIGEEAETIPINTIEIAQRELEIIGSRNGGQADAKDALEKLANGTIRPHIAARYPLDKINDAFALIRAGEANGRVIIDVS